jgi:hypothetical protein
MPEIPFQPECKATPTGTRPTISITAPAMNIGVRKALRETGSTTTLHLEPPNEWRVTGEPRADGDERVRCTRMLGAWPWMSRSNELNKGD